MKDTAAILCESVEFAYRQGSAPVLCGVNLEIQRGEFVVIAGPSGAGKSTLCRTFNNIIPLFFKGRFSGKRFVAGEWLDRQPIAQTARKVGMVFQDFEQQLFSTSALLEISFGLENFAVPEAEMKERMENILQEFNLSHLRGREPFSLSGGEKQKLAIASVMAFRPQILVLDEPTTDLDPDSRDFVLQVLPRLKKWVETMVIIDHETEQFVDADRIFLLNHGVIQTSGIPADLLVDSTALESNAIRPLDLVQVQQSLGQNPRVLSADALAEELGRGPLTPIAVSPRTSAEPVVICDRLSYQYEAQDEHALNDLSFEIRRGEFAAIIGKNGSGKSTLLLHLNGLQLPQTGSLRILGKETREWERKALARTVGLVFQNPDHQIFNATVREEVEFGPRRFHFSEEHTKRNAGRAMEIMDLLAYAERDPFTLSKGDRQRVAVASVLSIEPEVVILDEPTTGLDYRQQKYMMDLLRSLNQEGKTIIIVTHALRLVGEYCNYVLLLERGRKIAEGHPREILFQDLPAIRPTPLWRLSRRLNGNALTVEEFVHSLPQK